MLLNSPKTTATTTFESFEGNEQVWQTRPSWESWESYTNARDGKEWHAEICEPKQGECGLMPRRPLAKPKVRGSIPTTVYVSMNFNPFACCLYLMALVLVWYSSSQRAALIALTEGQLLMRCSLPANPTRKLGQIRLLSSKSFWVKMGKMFFFTKMLFKNGCTFTTVFF